MTLLWVGYLATRAADSASPGLARFFTVGEFLTLVGLGGTLVFGIWLSLSLDAYKIWDGWIIAASVLWVIASAVGGRSGVVARQPGRLGQAMTLHAISSAVILVILIDMIWKPGA